MNHQQSLLKRLNIQHVNPGVCTGPDGWLDSGAPPLVSFNPTTGEPLASVIPATPHTVDQAVAAARANFETWRQLPAPRRGLVVRDLGLAVRESLEPLGELITLEMGKIRAEGIGEVQEMIDICDFAVGLSRQLYGLTMPSERPGHRMAEQWHPLGPIGVITAFNFPVAVWSWNAAIAAVCGDTIVWKPSELTPLTAVALQHIANRVMADHGLSGVFTLTVGGPEVGRQLVADERLPLISFTGSTATGRRIVEASAGNLKKVQLELGGKGPNIVFGDANIRAAIGGSAFAIFHNQGQACIAGSRLILHKSISDEFIDGFTRLARSIRLGDPLDPNTEMGPLTSRQHQERVLHFSQVAKDEGGEIITGGKRPDRDDLANGYFVEPTIVVAKPTDRVSQEEVFGPFVTVTTFEDDEEALAIANGVQYGLGSGLWTNNLTRAHKFARDIRAGMVWINCYKVVHPGSPFGGVGESGYGREMGFEVMREYTQPKSVWVNFDSRMPPHYER